MKKLKNILKNSAVRVIIVELVCLVILWILGFRITYNDRLANNWDAIAACGTWFCGIVVPFAVVFIQHKWSESEKKAQIINGALLEEVNSLKTSTRDSSKNTYITSGDIYGYICKNIGVSTKDIAEHYGVQSGDIKSQLEDLWAVTELIKTMSFEDNPTGNIENCHWRKA